MRYVQVWNPADGLTSRRSRLPLRQTGVEKQHAPVQAPSRSNPVLTSSSGPPPSTRTPWPPGATRRPPLPSARTRIWTRARAGGRMEISCWRDEGESQLSTSALAARYRSQLERQKLLTESPERYLNSTKLKVLTGASSGKATRSGSW